MNKFTKKLIGTVITGAITIASLTSAFAETIIDSHIIAEPIGKTVIKSDKIQPCNCCCHCCHGVVKTGVFTGSSTINAAGRNAEITSADTFTVDDYVANTLINDVKSRIGTISS